MCADYKGHDIKPFMAISGLTYFMNISFVFNLQFYEKIVGIHVECIRHGSQEGNISVTTFTRRITNAEKVILRNNSWY